VTFSIAARCQKTGMFGVGISSSSPAVAARCAYARAGAGAVCSQNVTDPRLGTRGLNLLAEGATAEETLEILINTGAHVDYRQITVVDRLGGSAIYTGAKALGVSGEARGANVACAGNLLASPDVAKAMMDAFVTTPGALGERLIVALRAGRAAGGEAGPVHSAGLKLVRDVPWPVADLRVDWTEDDPVAELAKLWEMYAPQMDAYVQRALDPTVAPKFGVPGDQ
jgi:uncharacterized Ntn-hydrolase superfamily protein